MAHPREERFHVGCLALGRDLGPGNRREHFCRDLASEICRDLPFGIPFKSSNISMVVSICLFLKNSGLPPSASSVKLRMESLGERAPGPETAQLLDSVWSRLPGPCCPFITVL